MGNWMSQQFTCLGGLVDVQMVSVGYCNDFTCHKCGRKQSLTKHKLAFELTGASFTVSLTVAQRPLITVFKTTVWSVS